MSAEAEGRFGGGRLAIRSTSVRSVSGGRLRWFKDLLYCVNHLIETIPEVAEMDLKPIFVRQHDPTAVDARIAVHRLQPRRVRRPGRPLLVSRCRPVACVQLRASALRAFRPDRTPTVGEFDVARRHAGRRRGCLSVVP